ncbi:MAG: PAS domain-containing protein, partial [Pseudomonadota bacterium]|nr:PAS domain-containing protein [Pseudomonadota bacterium]
MPPPDHQRLALAMEAARFDLWETDPVAGTITRQTSRNFAELGYIEHRITIPMDEFFAIVHRDDLAALKAALDAHVAGACERFCCEYRMRTKDGAWIWYASRGKIIDGDAALPGRRF